MSLRHRSAPTRMPARAALHIRIVRLALAGLLGIAAALLVSCGGSSGKLIPVADAGPLQSDFETVALDAESGNGNCSTTESAILKTEQDFDALPASVDTGLRDTLRQGIENLRARALALCVQPLVQTTPTTTTPKTTPTTPTTTPTTTPATTPTSTVPTTTPTGTTPGGGTPAPGAGETSPGTGGAPGGGTGAGENGSANGANPAEGGAGAGGIGANGQEAAK
ncbi:MAG: hypothetical protein ACLPUT_16600 [Solirubrobacteraceae bacterium]